MKKCPRCNEILPECADTCPQCEVDLETGLSVKKQDNSSKEISSKINVKNISAKKQDNSSKEISSKIDDTVLLGGEIKDVCEKEDDSICQNCGKEIAIKSKVKFCPHCGKSIYFRKEEKSPSFDTGETPYHQDKFRCFDEAGQFVPTWNWAAFFFGIFWYLCKGMPAKAGIFLVVGIISTVIPLLLFLLPLYFGIAGNYDYYLLKVKGKQLW